MIQGIPVSLKSQMLMKEEEETEVPPKDAKVMSEGTEMGGKAGVISARGLDSRLAHLVAGPPNLERPWFSHP